MEHIFWQCVIKAVSSNTNMQCSIFLFLNVDNVIIDIPFVQSFQAYFQTAFFEVREELFYTNICWNILWKHDKNLILQKMGSVFRQFHIEHSLFCTYLYYVKEGNANFFQCKILIWETSIYIFLE